MAKSIQEFVPQYTEMTYRVEGMDVVEDINAFCEENRIDLVVMVSPEKQIWKRY